MITYVESDIFQSPARALVNTVNTVGVMGKGLAKDFKAIYPEMFREYQRLCEKHLLNIGTLWLYKTPNKWVLNFPTKESWRRPSKVEYIEAGLTKFVATYAEKGITSIAFPPLGCGNGELNWDAQVRPLMEKYLKQLPIDIFVHLYRPKRDEKPEHRDIKEVVDWLRSEPESLGFDFVWNDLKTEIGNRAELQTIVDKSVFHVGLEDDAALKISVRGEDATLPAEDLLDIWDSLRRYGFLMQDSFPAKYLPYFDQIVSLFASLEYCRPVAVGIDYKSVRSFQQVGIQLIPRARNTSPSIVFSPRRA